MDRRHYQCWNLKVPLRVFEADTALCVGHVLDVSLHGIKVVSDYPFDSQQETQFDLEIPDGHGQWRTTPVKALRTYSIQNTTSNTFDTGFKFIHVELESLLSLQKLIDELSSFS